MKRSAPMKRTRMNRAPIDRRRKVRTRSDFARIYGSRARVAWVKHQPCIVCVALSPLFGRTDGSSHNAHTETGGMGYKADYDTIVPLCASHHRRYDEHQSPLDTDDARRAIKAAASATETAWQRYLNTNGETNGNHDDE